MSEESSDPYQTLGVTHDADDEVIRAAWKAQVRKNHPDLVGESGAEKTAQVNAAYNLIRTSELRSRYDRDHPNPSGPAAETGHHETSAPESPPTTAEPGQMPRQTTAPRQPAAAPAQLTLGDLVDLDRLRRCTLTWLVLPGVAFLIGALAVALLCGEAFLAPLVFGVIGALILRAKSLTPPKRAAGVITIPAAGFVGLGADTDMLLRVGLASLATLVLAGTFLLFSALNVVLAKRSVSAIVRLRNNAGGRVVWMVQQLELTESGRPLVLLVDVDGGDELETMLWDHPEAVQPGTCLVLNKSATQTLIRTPPKALLGLSDLRRIERLPDLFARSAIH